MATDSGNITDTQRIVKRLLDVCTARSCVNIPMAYIDQEFYTKMLKYYLQIDLKEVGSGNGDLNQGNIILQIQKIRNVSAPKGNEESRGAPRMLKLSMTDGKNNFQALEVEHISPIR